MLGITIDDTTLLLSLAIVVALIISAAQTHVLQPALHPLVLARQGVPARVRAFQHSPVFRNANTPIGCHLAIRPRAAAQTVANLVRLGARTGAVTGTIGQGATTGATFTSTSALSSAGSAPTLAKSCNGTELLSLAAQLAAGLRVLIKSSLCVVLSADHVTDLAAATLLLPAVDTNETQRVKLLVLPPGPVPHCGPEGPRPIHALSTTAKVLQTGLLDAPMLTKTSVVIVPDSDLKEAQAVTGIESKQVLTFSQVIQASQGTNELVSATEAVSSISSLPTRGTDTSALTQPDSVYVQYYLPTAQRWARITESNLTSSVTAHLGMFAPDSIPTQRDRIGVISSIAAPYDSDAAILSPLATPSGLGLMLLAIYTGAGVQFDLDAFAKECIQGEGPTMLYSTPTAARAVATACVKHSQSSFLGQWAARTALYRLRHGALPPRVNGVQEGSGSAGSLWDWAYFRFARSSVIPHLRATRYVTIVSSTGRCTGQNTLDALRAYLGAPVAHAYLPASGQVAGYESLDSASQPLSSSEMATASTKLGISPGVSAVFTAPVSVSHAADLQAFEVGPYGAAHAGPPSVAAEVQLAESASLREQGWTIEPVEAKSKQAESLHTRWPNDPAGTVLVRGPITAFAFHIPPAKIPDPRGMWMSTNEVGSFRTNGTLHLVATHDHSNGTVVQNVVEDAPALGDAHAKGTRTFISPVQKQR